MAHDLATPTDVPERVPIDTAGLNTDRSEPHPAHYIRATRTLSACVRLIKRTHRLDLTDEEITAEVVAFDHAEALGMAQLGHCDGAA